MRVDWCVSSWFRIKNTHSQQSSLAQHWARDWRALALTQVHQVKEFYEHKPLSQQTGTN